MTIHSNYVPASSQNSFSHVIVNICAEPGVESQLLTEIEQAMMIFPNTDLASRTEIQIIFLAGNNFRKRIRKEMDSLEPFRQMRKQRSCITRK